MASRRLANNNSSLVSMLKSVVFPAIKADVAGLSGKEKDLAQKLIDNVASMFASTSDYIRDMSSTAVDASLNRAASLLDEVKGDFTSKELTEVKNAIVEAVLNTLSENTLVSSLTASDLTTVIDKLSAKIDIVSQQIVSSLADKLKDLMSSSTLPPQSTSPEASEDVPFASEQGKSDDVSKVLNEILKRLSRINSLSFVLMDDINAGFENVIQLITTVEKNITAAITGLKPTKKDKKAQKQEKKDMKSMQKMINEMSETIDKINKFIDNFIDFAIANLDKFLNASLKSIAAFFLKLLAITIAPTLALIGAFMYIIAEPFKKIMQPINELVGKLIEPINKIADGFKDAMKMLKDLVGFVLGGLKDIWNKVMVPFLEGFGTMAKAVGVGLANFIDIVLGGLTKLVEGMSTYAFAIGQGIGKFVNTVLDCLILFMEGIKTQAKAIGEAVGKVVLGLVNAVGMLVRLATEIGETLIDVVKVIHGIINIIKNFFDGLGTKAKQIGEKVGEVVLKTLDIIMKLLDKLFVNLDDITSMIQLYVIAPLNGLRRFINVALIDFKNSLWLPSFEFGEPIAKAWWLPNWATSVVGALKNAKFYKYYPFLGKKISFSEKSPVGIPNPDKGKDISELISEEMTSMLKKIDDEAKAKQAAELAAKIQQKNIESMLKGIDKISDIWMMVKNIEKILVDESPETRKIADLAVKPLVDTLNSIDKIDTDNKKNLQESLIQLKQKTDESKYTIDSVGSLILSFSDYAKGSFDIIMKKLDLSNVVPMPMIIPGLPRGANLADMES